LSACSTIGAFDLGKWVETIVIKPGPGVDPARGRVPGFMGQPGSTRVNPD